MPASFWESYSSFCNTAGGWIILGVTEARPLNIISGVSNTEKIVSDMWNILSNREKISFRAVENQDVIEKSFPEGKVVLIHIREVSDSMKPVYVNNRQDNTYIRTGDGDRKATKEEMNSFLRNAQPALDNLTAQNFTLDDLDINSLIMYKEIVNKTYPAMKYIEMTNEVFLTKIGAGNYNSENKTYTIKKGTVLFLGKVNSIKELYPHFHLDYFNRRGRNERWIDRISDDEPSEYEINIFNFYRLVYEKIKALLQESFRVDSTYQLRMPISNFDLSIRECLVNCLAHADYVQGYPSTKIDVYDGWFSFINPGKMLVSKEQFLIGGDSRPRNEIVMKLFRLMGASERQGFGGPTIYKAAVENDFRRPDIITCLERTELHIWNIDLADSYPDLEDEEKGVLKYIIKSERPHSVHDISKAVHVSDYRLRQIVEELTSRQLIQKVGNGPSTKYTRTEDSIEELTLMQIETDRMKKQLT